ncbi:MAG: CBS domain-containing protein [Planctomycetes bacterium]|nr:CBS domain-containing protein [Planctomycetota bacterium]
MTSDVKTCREWDSLAVAAHLMWDNDCGCVPVVDSERRVIGTVTDRDIAMATYHQGAAPAFISVGTVMRRDAFSCSPDDSLEDAQKQMRTHQVRRLHVVGREGHIVGILSLNDVARHAVRDDRAIVRQQNAEDLARTLATICEPRSSKSLERRA